MFAGEVFVLQRYQAKGQAAPEMPYVFGIRQAQVGVCLQWVGGGSLFLGFFLVTAQPKRPWVTDPLTTVPPESVAIGCSWTSCVGELVSGPGISGNQGRCEEMGHKGALKEHQREGPV